jgi:iron complex outermembrane recepter protein
MNLFTNLPTIGASLICLTALFTPSSAVPQNAAKSELCGRVMDDSNHPLAGVRVTLIELEREVRTDQNGGFCFAAVSSTRMTFVAQRSGYATSTAKASSASATLSDIVMHAAPFHLPAVSVTSARGPLMTASEPLSTSTIDEDQLRRYGSVSIAHALDRFAGVHTLATGQEMGKPVIRGMTGSRVHVLDGGHRLFDYSWSDEDGPSIDSRLADRLELVRGPMSVLYGSDALAGVVNVVPRVVPDAIGRSPFTRFGVEGYFASNNREGGTVLRGEGASGGFGWRAVAIGRLSEAIHTPAGELENTGFEALNGEAVAGVKGMWGTADLRYARYGGEFKLLEAGELPREGGEEEGEEEGGPVRKLGDDRVQLDLNLPFRSMRLEAKTQYQRHELAEVEEENEGGGGPEAEVEGLELLLTSFSLDALLHHSFSARNSGVIGVSGVLQNSDTRGVLPLLPDARTNSGGVFALEQWRAGRAAFVFGARMDVQHIDADANPAHGMAADDRSYSSVTANAGAVLDLTSQLTAAANIGRAWRAPNLFELYSDGPHLGEARYEIGDPAMQEEHSTNVDANLRLQVPRFHAELAGYINTVDHYIYITPTAEFREGLRVFRHAQADATLYGGEAAAEMEATEKLLLRARADYVHATNDDTNEPLPLIPPAMVEVGGELHGLHALHATNAYLSADVELHADPSRLAATDIATDGYTLLNIGAGIERHIGNRPLHIDMRVHNLTNAEYRDFLWRYKEFAPNPGRDITLRASIEL